jgi:hypothetical protein
MCTVVAAMGIIRLIGVIEVLSAFGGDTHELAVNLTPGPPSDGQPVAGRRIPARLQGHATDSGHFGRGLDWDGNRSVCEMACSQRALPHLSVLAVQQANQL